MPAAVRRLEIGLFGCSRARRQPALTLLSGRSAKAGHRSAAQKGDFIPAYSGRLEIGLLGRLRRQALAYADAETTVGEGRPSAESLWWGTGEARLAPSGRHDT